MPMQSLGSDARARQAVEGMDNSSELVMSWSFWLSDRDSEWM